MKTSDRESWIQRVDHGVLDRWAREGLNPTDVLAMLKLGNYARTSVVAFPSNEALGRDLGSVVNGAFKSMSDRGVRNVLKRLSNLGKVATVFRDAQKRERAGIVLLDREDGGYPIPAEPQETMTAAWVDSMKGCTYGTPVPSPMSKTPPMTELQFRNDGTPVPVGRNSSSGHDGTPVPQNKDTVNKDAFKKDKRKTTPLPPTAEPTTPPLGAGGSSSTSKARTQGVGPNLIQTFTQQASLEAPGSPETNDRGPGREICQGAPKDVLQAILDGCGESTANEFNRRYGELVGQAKGNPSIVNAAAQAVVQAVNEGSVRSPIGLLVKRIADFVADGVPEEFEDAETRKKRRALAGARARATQSVTFESDIQNAIEKYLRPSHGPDLLRNRLVAWVDRMNRELGLDEKQARDRYRMLLDLTTDEAMIHTQHHGVFFRDRFYCRFQQDVPEFLRELEGTHADPEIERLIHERFEARDVVLFKPLDEADRERRRWTIQNILHQHDRSRFREPGEATWKNKIILGYEEYQERYRRMSPEERQAEEAEDAKNRAAAKAREQRIAVMTAEDLKTEILRGDSQNDGPDRKVCVDDRLPRATITLTPDASASEASA